MEFALSVALLVMVCGQVPVWFEITTRYSEERVETVNILLSKVPQDAGLAVMDDLLPYFAERDLVSLITWKFSPFAFEYGTDFLLFDLNPVHMFPPYKKALMYLKNPFFKIPGYTLRFSRAEFMLYEKDPAPPDFYELIDFQKIRERKRKNIPLGISGRFW